MTKVLWRGTASSILLSWLLVAIFTSGFGLIVVTNAFTVDPSQRITGAAWLGPVAALIIGLAAALVSSRASLEVSTDGVRVRLGLGIPGRRFGWSGVVSVECIDVRPTQWGGWGYRWLPYKHARAVILRAGEGLRFTFADDRVFVITVDDAKRGLEIIRRILSDLHKAG